MSDDYMELVRIIKQAATDAVNAASPVAITYGKVVSVQPLEIKLDQKLTLSTAQLILCRNVTDFTLGQTKYGFALKLGDEVVMARQQGGQKYLVIDRLGAM
ncbi:MAG: DUF2577 domain-containing protein [Oscillospiraceae bacterium]